MKPTKKLTRAQKIAELRAIVNKNKPKPGQVRNHEYKRAMTSLHYYEHPEIRKAYLAKIAKVAKKPKTVAKKPAAKPIKKKLVKSKLID